MSTDFEHPLARKAKIWKAKMRDGAELDLLIVVTTLELDPAAHGYVKKHVERLTNEIEAYVAATPNLAGYALVDRPKDWDA